MPARSRTFRSGRSASAGWIRSPGRMVPTTVVSVHECELERRSGMEKSPGLASHKLMSWRALVPHGRSAATLRGRQQHLDDERLVLPPGRCPRRAASSARPVAAHRAVPVLKAGPPSRLGLVASLLGGPRSSGSLDHLTKPGEGCAVAGRRGPLKMPVRPWNW